MRRILPILLLLAAPAAAQERIPSHCIALAQGPEQVWRADFRAPLAADTVRISYVDHAMFLIQTPGGVAVATDYTGFLGTADLVPDVVTMNHAHGTHWTANPDPRIPHVLPGWGQGAGPAEHYLDLGEILIRNVATDIRRGGGVEVDGNSIFVFETAGLCIGHLGHLHHEPDPTDYAMIGRVDVVMVAVDGGLTLDIPTVLRVMERLRARVVIPMHWFGRGSLDAFVRGMEEAGYAVERPNDMSLVLGLADLPDRPTVVILEPRLLTD